MITDPKEGERYVVRGERPTYHDAVEKFSAAVHGEIVTVRIDGVDDDGDVAIRCSASSFTFISAEFLFPVHDTANITVPGPAVPTIELSAALKSFTYEVRTRDGAVLGTYTHEVTA